MTLTLGQIADILHAEGDFNTAAEATGYSIDSRTLAAGDLFFAVRGERTDGHDYIEAALANGAVAVVVSQRWLPPSTVDETRLLRLPDTAGDCILHGLQTLAHRTRRLWAGLANSRGKKRVIGITGSAGKTTTKECVAAVLAMRLDVLKTEGNLNNHFGLPLQLLRLQPEHDIAVLEMGMNHAGEIAALASFAEPDWAVLSNVAAVHTEFFPDGIEGVARAKKELVDALPPHGIAFLNADDARVARFALSRTDLEAVLYGTADNASVRAIDIEDLGLDGTRFFVTASGEQHPLHLRLLGRHNIGNALAAVAVGLSSGIPLPSCCEALEALQPSEKRGSVVEHSGARLINDTYNSNPHALDAMVATLASTPLPLPGGRRILVAGEMLELGPEGPALHAACGRTAARAGIDIVLGVRGLARHLTEAAATASPTPETHFLDTPDAAGTWLRDHLQPGDLVLLKASRGVRLERALDQLHP